MFIVGTEDYSKMAYNYLVDNSLTHRKYMCGICLKYVSDSLNKENDNIDSSNKVLSDENNEKNSNELEESIILSIEELLKKLAQKKNLEIIEKLNGKLQSPTSFISTNYVRPAISNNRQISSMYKDLNFLKKIDLNVYLADRKPILISFLKGIVSKSHCNPFLLAVIVEAIYHLKNTNLIRPHCFLTNLVKTFISGSKTVTAINGKILPGASDTSYRKWVNENGRETNGVPYCDLDVYVDNIGKYIVKKYRVHSERNNSPTVVTAVINIELQQNKGDTKNIQFIENLQPRYWQGTLNQRSNSMFDGKGN